MSQDSQLLLDVFDGHTAAQPDMDFLRLCDRTYTYSEFRRAYLNRAAKLAALGVGQSDVVPAFLPNSGPCVETWFALMHLGAIWCSMNTEFRGDQLANALNLIEAPVLLVDARFLDAVLDVLPQLGHVRHIVLECADNLPDGSKVEFVPYEALPDAPPPPRAAVNREDDAVIQFTSGSTGVSKAVQLSHGYLVGQGRQLGRAVAVTREDVLFTAFPLYHWDATIGTVAAAAVAGCTTAVAERFSASKFWGDVHALGATVFSFMGATLTFQMRVPEQPDDADNPVRLAWGVPMPDFKKAYEKRFGLKLIEGYGSTEGGVYVYQRVNRIYPPGSCGEVWPGYNLRIVDNDGAELHAGAVGEIITRPDDPTEQLSGYYNQPNATAEQVRDGWYHTGDLGWVDENGYLFFCGRKKDIIRRRGENISALEIENVIVAHPAVNEVAAFGIPSRDTDEEVAVAVALHKAADLTHTELLDFCAGRMAKYMLPEHVLFLDALPRTPTKKVAKEKLRDLHDARVNALGILE